MKIYSGYRTTRTDVYYIFKELKELKKEIQPKIKSYFLEVNKSVLVLKFNELIFQGISTDESCLYYLAKHMMEDFYKRGDFNCDVVLYPLQDQTLMIIGGFALFTRYLEGLDWVDPYYYFDNTDIPKGITEEEWDDRACNWDKALDFYTHQTFGEAGLYFQIHPIYPPLLTNLEDVVRNTGKGDIVLPTLLQFARKFKRETKPVALRKGIRSLLDNPNEKVEDPLVSFWRESLIETLPLEFTKDNLLGDLIREKPLVKEGILDEIYEEGKRLHEPNIP